MRCKYIVFFVPRVCLRISSPAASVKTAAFSLVEVVLAIGVVAFAFVAIFGLLPVGLTTFREAMGTTVGGQIAQRVLNEAQQTDFDVLIDHIARSDATQDDVTFRAPSRADQRLRYFDDQGGEVVPQAQTLSDAEKARIIYWVNTRITIRTPRPKAAVNGATNSGRDALDLAIVTVQVATNPGNQTLKIHVNPPLPDDENDPLRNLFEATPGVKISNWSTMVARNQPSPPPP